MARYERIADGIRHQILAGRLAPGARLPSEEALSLQHKVSRLTIRQALGVLQTEGLVIKEHGRGSFVRDLGPRVVYTNDRHHHPDHSVGAHTHVTMREVKATEELCQLLDVPPGTRLLEYHYLSHHGDDPPFALARAYLPDQNTRSPFPEPPPSPWADDLCPFLTTAGTNLDHTIERITARPPTPEETETLQLTPGTPVLAIHRQTIDTHGNIAEAAILTLPGTRTEASYTTPIRH